MKIKLILLAVGILANLSILPSEKRKSIDSLELYIRASKRLMDDIAQNSNSLDEYRSKLRDAHNIAQERLGGPLEIKVSDGEALLTSGLISVSPVLETLVLGGKLDFRELKENKIFSRQIISDLNRLVKADVLEFNVNITNEEDTKRIICLLLAISFLQLDSKYVGKIQFDHIKFTEFFNHIMSGKLEEEYSKDEADIIKKYLRNCKTFVLKNGKVLKSRAAYILKDQIFGSFEIMHNVYGKCDCLAFINLATGEISKPLAYGEFFNLFKIDDNTFLVNQYENWQYKSKKIIISGSRDEISMVDFLPYNKAFESENGSLVLFSQQGDTCKVIISDVNGNIKSRCGLPALDSESVVELGQGAYLYHTGHALAREFYRIAINNGVVIGHEKIAGTTDLHIYEPIKLRNHIMYLTGGFFSYFDLQSKGCNSVRFNSARFESYYPTVFKLLKLDDRHFVSIAKDGVKTLSYQEGSVSRVRSTLDIKLSAFCASDNQYYYVVPESGTEIIQIPLSARVSCDFVQEKQAAATSADAK